MQHEQISACYGKFPHQSYDAARRVAVAVNHRGKKSNRRFSIYRCPHCAKFHIGGA